MAFVAGCLGIFGKSVPNGTLKPFNLVLHASISPLQTDDACMFRLSTLLI